ncbi:ABC transporter permease [Isosphaeraceae bacterium EP7]
MNSRTAATVPHTEFFPSPPASKGHLRWLVTIAKDRRELTRFWPVVQNMVSQDLKIRYQRSVLGFFWTLLNPILMMTTLTLVFGQMMSEKSMWSYAIYLFSGMVPWMFLSASLSECSLCIIVNESLIRKIYLPKLIFPLTRVLISLTTFVLSMVALFLMLKPMGAQFHLPMLMLPLVVLLWAAFTLGLGLIVATMNTFYRDCGHLVSVVLQAWYFATPIIYDERTMGAGQAWKFWINPAFPFIRLFQGIISDGQWPQGSLLLIAAAIATGSLGIGYAAFKCNEDKMVFRL